MDIKLLERNIFLLKLQSNIDEIYTTDNTFSVITLCIEQISSKCPVYHGLSFLAKYIYSALINAEDCFTFFDNRFYILTKCDNNELIDEFLNSLAISFNQTFQNVLVLHGAYIQYPYDSTSTLELLEYLDEKIDIIVPKENSIEEFLLMDKNESQKLSFELLKHLELIKEHNSKLYNHTLSVAKLVTILGKKCELSPNSIKELLIGAILHDIGYLAMPSFFNKENKDKIKIEIVKKLHPLIATRRILKNRKFLFGNIFPLLEQHHEYLDGHGYPFGLKAEELSKEAQILSVVDVYDILKRQSGSNIEYIKLFFLQNYDIKWQGEIIEKFVEILEDKKELERIEKTNIDIFYAYLS